MNEIFNSPKKSVDISFQKQYNDDIPCLYEIYNGKKNKIYKEDGKLWVDGFNSRYQILINDRSMHTINLEKIPLKKIGGNNGYSYIVKIETLSNILEILNE